MIYLFIWSKGSCRKVTQYTFPSTRWPKSLHVCMYVCKARFLHFFFFYKVNFIQSTKGHNPYTQGVCIGKHPTKGWRRTQFPKIEKARSRHYCTMPSIHKENWAYGSFCFISKIELMALNTVHSQSSKVQGLHSHQIHRIRHKRELFQISK